MMDALGVQLSADQIALAVYQFEGEADYWWDATKTTVNLTMLTWTQFETIFLEKYFPEPMKDEMAQEFLSLRQETMTVTQYMSQFEELSRHATEFIQTETAKARRFEWGLNHTFREKVVGMRFPTYAQVVQATLINEMELNDSRKIGNEKRAIQQQEGPIRNNNQGYLAPTPYSHNHQNNPQPLQ